MILLTNLQFVIHKFQTISSARIIELIYGRYYRLILVNWHCGFVIVAK